MPRRLPPLNALRAFEAAGRRASMSAAAQCNVGSLNGSWDLFYGNAGDALYSHNGLPFSTFDVDNDNREGDFAERSCARLYKVYKNNSFLGLTLFALRRCTGTLIFANRCSQQ